ncbi:unnamed protein product [Spirodela intermedia]|uniref:Reverse transcriptase Ty1/copia-type domain-containing protein n=1 Tax=Spirodela intermedia TaxID=51605 RepID=A0A7I8L3W0_SPIIN|nr:unnamed protein product [Spirodela intermedia]
MEQPSRYVAQEKSSKMCLLRKFNGLLTIFGFSSCDPDLIALTKKIKGDLVILTVYVDDILVTENDEAGIHSTKAYMQQHFNILDLETPRYFLGIKFTY